MESGRFDGWVRAWTAGRSRRGAVLGLLGGGLSLIGLSETRAKKH
jgi:hypothetical protein